MVEHHAKGNNVSNAIDGRDRSCSAPGSSFGFAVVPRRCVGRSSFCA